MQLQKLQHLQAQAIGGSGQQQQQTLSISPAEVSKRGIGQQQISPSSSFSYLTPSHL